MELWIPITLAAAFLQNIRSSLQKHLKGRFGTIGATFVRFGFGLPAAAAFVIALHTFGSQPVPRPGGEFAFWIVVAALGQIGAQLCLIAAFAHHNFAVATAYSRTEPLHAALFGAVLLGEHLIGTDGLAVALALIGVILISLGKMAVTPVNIRSALSGRGAALGLASGLLFGLAAVAYRAASTSLGGPTALMQGAVTLLVAITIQSVLLFVWLALRDRPALSQIAHGWKIALAVGLVGATASLLWFTAMTLQQAAVVKALAQIELLFAYVSGAVLFRERLSIGEMLGCAAIVCGVILLLLG